VATSHEPGTATIPRHPWDRQPGETDAAYRAFQTYLKLGAGRSLSAVRGQRKGNDRARKGNAPPGHITRWSVVHRWVERADAWDRHVTAAESKALEDAAVRGARARADRIAAWREQSDLSTWGAFALQARRLDKIAKAEDDPKMTPASAAANSAALDAFLKAREPVVRMLDRMDAANAHANAAPSGVPDLPPDEEFAAMRAINELRRAKEQTS
jgi:hypothetical protein